MPRKSADSSEMLATRVIRAVAGGKVAKRSTTTGAKRAIADVAGRKPTRAAPAGTPVLDVGRAKLAAARADRTGYFVGAHVSIAGGAHHAAAHTASIGGSAMALFVRSQRKWTDKPRSAEDCKRFRDALQTANLRPEMVLVHGSYLINLAESDPEKRTRALDAMIDEVSRCHDLGLTLYNFHPGSAGTSDRQSALLRVAQGMNHVLAAVPDVVLVVECMAGQGTVLGKNFKELRTILDAVDADKRSRTGVCIDTCHLFASGSDIRSRATFDAAMLEFDRVVGMKTLRGLHLNDSKADLASHVDRHEHIGVGRIGTDTFRFIMQDKRFTNMPLILETPERDGNNGYRDETDLLYGFCGPEGSLDFKEQNNGDVKAE